MTYTRDMPSLPLMGQSGRLPHDVSIVGLGCSSFSTFFWSSSELQRLSEKTNWTVEELDKDHPRVQQWIRTIHYAIRHAGITCLDTAPWYGHGTSETVIGWALDAATDFDRTSIQINTKVGRYEANPSSMFDFSRKKTQNSIELSLRRLKCGYIDVLQLHDPEFAPSIDQLLEETIPVMLDYRNSGKCKALGLTGYPLNVQHLILQQSMEKYGENIWDQSLTYCHYNLHDQSLLNQPCGLKQSFVEACRDYGTIVLAAAPLSMGLLTNQGPRDWHPASPQLKEACKKAADICQNEEVDISSLAILFALSNPLIPCTILGMKNEEEVKFVAKHAKRIGNAVAQGARSQDEILDMVMSEKERRTLMRVLDPIDGPFSSVLETGLFEWDGVNEAWKFRIEQGMKNFVKWQK